MNKEYMTKFFIILFFLIATFFVFPVNAPAESLKVKISPRKINPGDAFLIKVTGVKTSFLPSVSFAKRNFHFSGCGENCYFAVGAVDIKTKPGIHTVKVKIGKKKRNLKLSVRKARFPKLKISLPDDKVLLAPDDLDRVRKENEKLELLFQRSSEKLWFGDFIVPLENDRSIGFGTKRIMNRKWLSVHKGMDIRGQEGEEVKASNNGKVVLAEELFFGGNTVILDHGQGIYTVYMHLSKFKANPEGIVSKGDIIGFVGSSGRSSGPHLHFGVKILDINVNPVSLMKLELEQYL